MTQHLSLSGELTSLVRLADRQPLGIPASTSPALGLWVNITVLDILCECWRPDLGSLCLCVKHFTV